MTCRKSLLTASRFLFLDVTMCSLKASLSSCGTFSLSHSCWIFSLWLSHIASFSALRSSSCGTRKTPPFSEDASAGILHSGSGQSFLITTGAGWHGQKVRLTWQMSSFRDVIFSLERQNESSSSHTTSFSKLVSGMWSSSSMCNIICFFRAMNSACRLTCKHKWLIL